MTAHVNDPAAHGRHTSPIETAGEPRRATIVRPRWLMPAVVGGLAVGALVVAGVLPLSIVLYAALFGGCALMHVFGHGGHGGHGGGGHAAHGDEPAQGRTARDVTEDLSRRSPGSQSLTAASEAGLDDRAATSMTTDETTDDDQHRSHSCH